MEGVEITVVMFCMREAYTSKKKEKNNFKEENFHLDFWAEAFLRRLLQRCYDMFLLGRV